MIFIFTDIFLKVVLYPNSRVIRGNVVLGQYPILRPIFDPLRVGGIYFNDWGSTGLTKSFLRNLMLVACQAKP